jgi:hypothetical protein
VLGHWNSYLWVNMSLHSGTKTDFQSDNHIAMCSSKWQSWQYITQSDNHDNVFSKVTITWQCVPQSDNHMAMCSPKMTIMTKWQSHSNVFPKVTIMTMYSPKWQSWQCIPQIDTFSFLGFSCQNMKFKILKKDVSDNKMISSFVISYDDWIYLYVR